MISASPFPSRSLLGLARLVGLALSVALAAGCRNDPNPKPLHEKRPDGSPWIVRHVYLPDEIRSLDPQVAYDQMSHTVLSAVQDTLLEYNPMKTDPYELEPDLLEAMPERVQEPDGKVTYVCRLKPQVFYHDDPCFPDGKGREVIAEDVQYAFQRIADPAVICPIESTFVDYIDGLQEMFDAAKKAGSFDYANWRIRGIEVVDRYTFKIHLLKPYPQILYWMALHFTCPVAREGVAYYDGKPHPDGPKGATVNRPPFKFHPVGNGPFSIYEHIDGQSFRFVRNPNYHCTVFPSSGWPPEREATNRPLAGHALPLVDEVDVPIFREILPIWLRTRQGYLDYYNVMKDAANSAIATTKELAPKYRQRGMKLEKALEPSTFYLCLNMQDPLLGKNKKLRQALSCAFDSQGYVDLAYGGVAPVATQLLPPGLYGFDKDFKNPYGPNLEKGRKLLAEAGYPNGIDPATNRPLEITMDAQATGGEERQLAEYEQRQLEQLGVHVRIIENEFARLTQKENDGNFQISDSGWGADYPDPENFFFLFYGKNFPPEGQNYCRYANPEFDRLFEQMSVMENGPERLEIVHKMNEILEEDCPMILRFNKGYYVIAQPWAPITQMNLLLERGYKYFPIDQEMRDKLTPEWNPVPKWPIAAALAALAAAGVYAWRLNRGRYA